MKRLCIISPVYNEAEVIQRFYQELKQVLYALRERYDARILLVIDRSTDDTADIVRRLAAQDPSLQALILSSRFGHQMSLLAGIDYAEADVLIMMDSDLQHPPGLIPEMLSKYESGFDIVYTRRLDTKSVGWLKRLCTNLFYRGINMISEVPIHANTADFRLISSRVAKIFREKIRERKLFLRGLISWVGFSQYCLDFTVGERGGGASKYSFRRMLNLALDGTISVSKKPLKTAIVAGFLFAFLGIGLVILTFIQYFVYDQIPSGWTTLAIMIPLFSGIQLLFLGIIGEYIGAIFDEVKARPHYLINEAINLHTDQLH